MSTHLSSDSKHSTFESSNPEQINDALFEEMRDLLEEDFCPLVHDYMQSSVERVQQLKDAVANNDNGAGFEVAHSLKGACANLGLTQLSELSHQMQEAFRNQDFASGSKIVEKLEQEVVATNDLIQTRLNA